MAGLVPAVPPAGVGGQDSGLEGLWCQLSLPARCHVLEGHFVNVSGAVPQVSTMMGQAVLVS